MRGQEQLVSYYCSVGMRESDIIHSLMTVKEMIYCGYQLNEYLFDDMVNNSKILTGEREFFETDPQTGIDTVPKWHVPVFQPFVIQQVPTIDRSSLLFPINMADFIYPKGVRILSAYEV
jgi:hypothetical protein